MNNRANILGGGYEDDDIKRRVFYSFHYADALRVSQIRMNADKQDEASDNEWETVKKDSDEAISRWIRKQIDTRSCVIVLIGQQTAWRKWVRYEIEYAVKKNKGLFGIHINNLKDMNGNITAIGENPFHKVLDYFISSDYKVYETPQEDALKYILGNIRDWIKVAIAQADKRKPT